MVELPGRSTQSIMAVKAEMVVNGHDDGQHIREV